MSTPHSDTDHSEVVGAVMTAMEKDGLACEPALLVVQSKFEGIPWDTFWNKVRPTVHALRPARPTRKNHHQPQTHASQSHEALARIEDSAPVIG